MIIIINIINNGFDEFLLPVCSWPLGISTFDLCATVKSNVC